MSSDSPVAAPGVRLDIWLWAARFYKTRSLAKQAVETGKVDVAGQRAKPSRIVRVGDELKVVRGEDTYGIRVEGLSEQRGPAPVAQALYRESDESRQRREAAAATRRAERTGYQAPLSKPDKRARRLIRALGDIDAM
ncbi:RNA-binding S4 domain-containing protein [Pseudoxanthomonas sp. 22568]|uniref:RNA-binding S4 domain-containing protein n=1 Tax=Pseudoxanthomonas sp. 22568 TaxID=3453945 RepID=UPI003F83F22A